VETVEFRHGPARPGHPLTHMGELTGGPVEPGHDEKVDQNKHSRPGDSDLTIAPLLISLNRARTITWRRPAGSQPGLKIGLGTKTQNPGPPGDDRETLNAITKAGLPKSSSRTFRLHG
jgi:hypothetical protein